MSEKINFLTIEEIDYKFLYELLLQRKKLVNISHKKMPTYIEHTRFVLSNPYSKWYIILHKNKKIGNAYLTKTNEIGIFILKSIKIKGVGKIVLEEIIKMNPRSRYLANVSPKNDKSSIFFKKNGFKLIQYTYELTLD